MENEVKNETENVQQQVVSPTESPKPKKKGHGPLYWVIVVAGVAFIVYMSMQIGEKLSKTVDPETNTGNNSNVAEESNSNTESNSNSGVKDVDKTTAQGYVDGYKNFFTALSSKGLTDQTKLDFVFSVVANSDDNIATVSHKCSEVFNDCDREQGHRPSGNNSYAVSNMSDLITYSYDTINKLYQKSFGSSTNVAKINSLPYEYSSKINSWALLEAQFGAACSPEIKTSYVVDSATEENGKVIVKVTYLDYTVEHQNGDCTTEKISGYSYSINGTKSTVQTENEITNILTKNHDSLSHLTLTFEKDNGNYVLTAVSK